MFQIPQDLKKYFKEFVANIIAVGTGKTHSCARLAIVRLETNTSDLLMISTMSNALINGLIKEICKCFRLYTYSYNEELLLKIENFDDNVYDLLKSIGILVLNTFNSINTDDLLTAKVIITNHAYFFPHGHDNNYNLNCYKIQKFLNENKINLHIVKDEFDQFHKMGTEVIPMNFFIGMNLVDSNRNQVFIADHAFRWCHKNFCEKMTKELCYDDFENDYYYKLPIESFKKKFENNSVGVKYFSHSIGGKYDFQQLILNNLQDITDTRIVYCGQYGKKVGAYLFKRYNEIVRCKINSDIFQDEGVTSKFLKINNSIIMVTQKIEVEDSNGDIIQLDTRESVVEFAKNNLSKKEWIDYYNTLSAEGKDLYVTKLLLRKKEFKFSNATEYYITATPGILQELGYTINRDMEFDTPCKIKKMDIFVVQNKKAAYSDMYLMFDQLKKMDFYTLSIINKKEVIKEFCENNKENSSYKNVNAVIDDMIIDLGKEPSNIRENNKNITYIYQKGNQSQGTNYSNHVLVLQDCHVKVDIMERIVETSEDDYIIYDYNESCKKQVTQSCGRILRGDKHYKSLVMFDNFEEENGIIDHLKYYLMKYGIEVNLIYCKEAKKMQKRKEIFLSVLKHIEDRDRFYNQSIEAEMYTYSNDELYCEDGRKKYDPIEIVNEYCKLRLLYTRDKDIKPKLIEKFGISDRQFMRIKKTNIELIDEKLNSYLE